MSITRFCVAPCSLNGLGNQFFCWAKAFVAAQELAATALPPAWSRNPRGYRRLFNAPPFDWEAYRLLSHVLPTFELTEADFHAAHTPDYGEAVRHFADRLGLSRHKAFLLITPGMWGGYLAIRRARHFILHQLYGTRGVAGYLYRYSGQTDPAKLTVAVHIRRGDFLPVQGAEAARRGALNTAVPLDWYRAVCGTLRRRFGRGLELALFSDGTDAELRGFVEEFRPLRPPAPGGSEATDLLLMSSADLLVCSNSTFSLLGAFLSNGPYLWFEPQLAHGGDFYTLANEGLAQQDAPAGHEHGGMDPGGAPSFPRGLPVRKDGALPDTLFAWLDLRRGMKRAQDDLLFYGRVPAGGRR